MLDIIQLTNLYSNFFRKNYLYIIKQFIFWKFRRHSWNSCWIVRCWWRVPPTASACWLSPASYRFRSWDLISGSSIVSLRLSIFRSRVSGHQSLSANSSGLVELLWFWEYDQCLCSRGISPSPHSSEIHVLIWFSLRLQLRLWYLRLMRVSCCWVLGSYL